MCQRSRWLCWHPSEYMLTTLTRCPQVNDFADTHFLRISSRKRKSSQSRFCLFIWGPGWISLQCPFKGGCHESFYLHFFHDSNLSGPPINRLNKVFLNSVSDQEHAGQTFINPQLLLILFLKSCQTYSSCYSCREYSLKTEVLSCVVTDIVTRGKFKSNFNESKQGNSGNSPASLSHS